MPHPTVAERVSQRLDQKYELLGLIAQGGMGAVYRARHTWTDREVAVKVLHVDRDWRESDVQRLLLEARSATRLQHPNVVDVLDMGRAQDGAPYLVMTYLRGRTLEQALVAEGPVPLPRVLQWLSPIMGALACAHDAGIVHRDVKPSNIFLREERGQVIPTLLDFGIAKLLVADGGGTETSAVIGTPAYMSPEQLDGGQAEARSDVWAMGVTMYRALTGELPFRGGSAVATSAKILYESAPSLVGRAELPRGVAACIDRALERKAQQRYGSMRELAHALATSSAAAGVLLPRDPEPLGLPDWACWCALTQRDGEITRTLDLAPGDRTEGAPLAAQRAARSEPSIASLQRPSSAAQDTRASGRPLTSSRSLLWGMAATAAATLGASAWLWGAHAERNSLQPSAAKESSSVASAAPAPSFAGSPVTNTPAAVESARVPAPASSPRPPERASGLRLPTQSPAGLPHAATAAPLVFDDHNPYK